MKQRPEYLKRLIKWKEKHLIKVITGVRRCGKSTLMSLFIEYLKSTGVGDDQIVAVNLEDIENKQLLNNQVLYDYLKERLCDGKYTYVFIDEVQQCPQFETVVDSLFLKENVDVYITGSIAYMLSGELITLLSGRYVEIRMLPLSFSEYLSFTGNSRTNAAFNNYLKYGSFPYVAALDKETSLAKEYIDGIYNTILIKDVAKREGIRDISVLESIVTHMSGHIGRSVSVKKICDTINASGRKVSINTVERYMRALTDSMMFCKIDRYDIKAGQSLKTLGKYYIVDSGFRDLLLSGSAPDLGLLLENIVYLELIRRGYKVNIGKIADKEVDFVARHESGRNYYQVAVTTLAPDTLTNELEPLQMIQDHHPKYLLTLDEFNAGVNHNGIRQYNVLDWLTNAVDTAT